MGLIPRLKHAFNQQEILAALRLSKGNIVKFETEFANRFQCSHGTMFAHGRSGIYALLKVWHLENAEIICPAYTCVVVPHAIVLSGNVPVFVDCEKGSLNMSYSGIEQSLSEKTRVIIVTHVFGYPMDVQRIQEIVDQAQEKYGHKIYVIQDVAYSFGAYSKGKMVTQFGDASIFGLNISKILSSIFGGMVITNDKQLDEQLKAFRSQNCKRSKSHGLRRFLYLLAVLIAFNLYVYKVINLMERSGMLNRFVKYYDEGSIEFPTDWDEHPTAIEARVGLEQLKKYDQIIGARKRNTEKWKEHLNGQKIKFFDNIDGATYSHCVGLVENRDQWVNDYLAKGVQLGIVIEYCIPYMKSYKLYKKGEYPISKYYSEHMINFPVWSGLPEKLTELTTGFTVTSDNEAS